ncbi:hypothetical protein A3D05_00995 [Candidatus Gottesmanbacteria bacterium RIFCSPHIGHO2_02_FULL_40_24]|uniref:Uncharacterized protein n=1 Tax=Candidatus Gottesmanbacteria bacterium RIFCSPHIGHO2_01_FULL_40_15 TaxID=1798376 RepID=A0A1F5Z0M0_9BACT|nr:MAG: hypothetical protein A2777_00340 [Candidatus Gottesmanbacteria bacterium RIFCSPHIGHO2_01_FULL_40_15]OGG17053.1 MAG: hypothetical protein A3D05_00995 [Candidatus Gottesmanbacteria bacterium RIFCSPHIGHO2_02_FULL_40_24]OGG21307.1 MAG: hypothetical protein A3B48_04760 [Candidatus Gottesmanbacteria bacterium RIFCSPLOWO2_01_FULL_40_10]OGG23427.1 MAG: hypothetical protein A3E42_00070 [Candidatus Gottesmanbacteria bacterium RIFCSPHIGHO2_12_FULL_40_13]OGG33026.1 MAG: hypothetical protein A3I80_0
MKHILPPGEKLQSELDKMPPHSRKELESWIVNSVKINLIKKFEQILEIEGKSNLRKLLLVPVFTVSELTVRIKENAPELLTLFYKELFTVYDDASRRLS